MGDKFEFLDICCNLGFNNGFISDSGAPYRNKNIGAEAKTVPDQRILSSLDARLRPRNAAAVVGIEAVKVMKLLRLQPLTSMN